MPDVLPPLFATWAKAFLPGSIPTERAASCHECAMVRPDDVTRATGDTFYSPATKCCTYVPELPNFVVGRILVDDDVNAAAGRATVQARIARRAGVSPLGLSWTPRYETLYRASPASFGRAESMRCPHYLVDGGLCGVWSNRESVCATWFCKHDRGGTGQSFWQRLRDTLSLAEEAVRIACLLELDVDVETLAALSPTRAMTDASPSARALSASELAEDDDPALYAARWGSWSGREGELFAKCASHANGLSWADVSSLGGAKLALSVRLLHDA